MTFRGCPVENETPGPCPRCGATVSGNDIVNGICQAPKLDAIVISDKMVDAALTAWFASPPSETDQGLERSMRAALEAALSR